MKTYPLFWWLRESGICLQCQRHRFNPWVGKIPWRRERQPTPMFLPNTSHGLRSLVGYSPWGCKESDTTERLTLHTHVSSLILHCKCRFRVKWIPKSMWNEEHNTQYKDTDEASRLPYGNLRVSSLLTWMVESPEGSFLRLSLCGIQKAVCPHHYYLGTCMSILATQPLPCPLPWAPTLVSSPLFHHTQQARSRKTGNEGTG